MNDGHILIIVIALSIFILMVGYGLFLWLRSLADGNVLKYDKSLKVEQVPGIIKQSVLSVSLQKVPPNKIIVAKSERVRSPFKGEKIIIPKKLGDKFLINDIRVGNVSQLVSSTPNIMDGIPAEAFNPDSLGNEIDMDTVQTAMQIELWISNITNGELDFEAAIMGKELI